MAEKTRSSNRKSDELRAIRLTRHYTMHAEGSVLVEFGDTKVLCNATVEDSVPRFLKGTGKGWITAEYGMLPRSQGVEWTVKLRKEGSPAEVLRFSV